MIIISITTLHIFVNTPKNNLYNTSIKLPKEIIAKIFLITLTSKKIKINGTLVKRFFVL